MTPSQIETAARRMMNAVGSNFWSPEEIIGDYLYMAALELATETNCIENRYTTPSVASQQEYAIPSRMIAVKRVSYNGKRLDKISFEQLDLIQPDTGTAVEGTPLYYYYFDSSFGLYPVPDTSALTIKIQTYDEPDVPTSTSTLQIPTQFHQYLVIGTAYYMSLKELGHPNVSRFEWMWNHSNNRRSALQKTKASMMLQNQDSLPTVQREEDLPYTRLGIF